MNVPFLNNIEVMNKKQCKCFITSMRLCFELKGTVKPSHMTSHAKGERVSRSEGGVSPDKTLLSMFRHNSERGRFYSDKSRFSPEHQYAFKTKLVSDHVQAGRQMLRILVNNFFSSPDGRLFNHQAQSEWNKFPSTSITSLPESTSAGFLTRKFSTFYYIEVNL